MPRRQKQVPPSVQSRIHLEHYSLPNDEDVIWYNFKPLIDQAVAFFSLVMKCLMPGGDSVNRSKNVVLPCSSTERPQISNLQKATSNQLDTAAPSSRKLQQWTSVIGGWVNWSARRGCALASRNKTGIVQWGQMAKKLGRINSGMPKGRGANHSMDTSSHYLPPLRGKIDLKRGAKCHKRVTPWRKQEVGWALFTLSSAQERALRHFTSLVSSRCALF